MGRGRPGNSRARVPASRRQGPGLRRLESDGHLDAIYNSVGPTIQAMKDGDGRSASRIKG
jgi:hypothetical protein